MQVGSNARFELTYCTNIHPGETWPDVFTTLQQAAPELKRRLSPDARFGLGLRLSSQASEQLLQADALPEFRAWLDANGCYVAIINGFPYGAFHDTVIKSKVFAPDWRDAARVAYTLRLVDILAALLPADLDGGISTSPLSYKRWINAANAPEDWRTMTRNVVEVVAAMARTRQTTGKFLHLDIEPEPDGLLENSAETIAFFETWLLPEGGPLLADTLGMTPSAAEECLRDHVQVCYDTCHFAVEYEAPDAALARFQAAGLKIGRVQISSALKAPLPDAPAQREELAAGLAPFAESTYLHQVLERRRDGGLRHHADLSEALPHIADPDATEWRIHFHVPLFADSFGTFGSTQDHIRALFPLLQAGNITRHLEIETYTWDVLPPALKRDRLDSIEREFRWVLETFA